MRPCYIPGYVIGEKVAAKEGRSPRDTLSINLVVFYLSLRERRACSLFLLDAKRLGGLTTNCPHHEVVTRSGSTRLGQTESQDFKGGRIVLVHVPLVTSQSLLKACRV